MKYDRLEPLDLDTDALRGSTVTVVGAGATGSRMLEQLARLGADLKIVDRDFLEESNLATSALYTEGQVEARLPKAVAAAERLEDINSGIKIEAEVADLNAGNADELLGTADIVLDGTDNMETRFLINEWCVKNEVPWVHVAALAESGEAMPVIPGNPAKAGDRRTRSDLPPGSPGACFSCVFEGVEGSSLETCETAGIHPGAASVAASLGVEASLQVLEGEVDAGLKRFDLSAGEMQDLTVHRRMDCTVCGGEFPYLQGEKESSTTSVCGEGKYQVNPGSAEVELERVKSELEEAGEVEINPHLLRFESDPADFTLFRDGRMIVEAESRERARSIYSRFVGI